MSNHIASTALHEIPKDIEGLLTSNKDLLAKWNAITDIARNEWVCWVTIVKKEETRTKHLMRLKEDLLNGKKRPCCWPGCPHRNKKAAKYFT